MLGILLAALTAGIIFGGMRRVATVAQNMVPIMAGLYLLIGIVIVGLHLGELPRVVGQIVTEAVSPQAAIGGGIGAVIVNGVQRGMLSNEAGMGSVPNVAATASVSHPVKQGLVQTLGVYFDTLLICSITAFIVLLSNPTFGDERQGASLTQSALGMQLGDWAVHFLTVAIFLFAWSSVIGNYYYGESNIRFMTKSRAAMNIYRFAVLVCVFLGAMLALDLVWSLADLFMALMATLNLIALCMLAGVAAKVLANYMEQRKAGVEPVFKAGDVPGITGLSAWDGTDTVTLPVFWEQRANQKNGARR